MLKRWAQLLPAEKPEMECLGLTSSSDIVNIVRPRARDLVGRNLPKVLLPVERRRSVVAKGPICT